MSAIFSPCGKYRYTLHRKLHDILYYPALFIMLNPSTADATQDDPTIRRCIYFARREGCSNLTVVNLFALRSPDPEALKFSDYPLGEGNDAHIQEQVNRCREVKGLIVSAWGAHPFAKCRADEVLRKFGPMACLGKTKDGSPRHPLYVKSTVLFMPLETT